MDCVEEDEHTKLQWLWIIEYLASLLGISASILHDLIELAPELPEDLGKNAREMVALRCLDGLFPSDDELATDVSPNKDSKCSFDLSQSCSEVLEFILQETSDADLIGGGPALLKWDVRPFIVHKRASMPKCALQELKDGISDNNHPGAASFEKQESREMYVDDNEDNLHARGTQNMVKRNFIRGESSRTIHTMPSKRNRSDLETENVAGHIQEGQDTMNDSNNLNVNVKKLRRDTSSIDPSVGKCSLPVQSSDFETEVLHYDQTKLDHNTNRASQGTFVDECMQLGLMENANDTEQLTLNGSPSIRSRHKDSADETENGCIGVEVENEVDKITNRKPPDTSVDVCIKRDLVDEVHDTELRKSTSISTEHEDSAAELNEKGAHDFRPKSPNTELHGLKEKTNADHIEEQTSTSSGECNGEATDISKKKRRFLNSQLKFSQNLSASADWTEQNDICVKCNDNGQLLVCSTSSCPLKIHEICFSSRAKFDENGNFYCPFCAYFQAITEYLETKKETSLARKDLATFIQTGFNYPDLGTEVHKGVDLRGAENNINLARKRVIEVNDERRSGPSASCANLDLPRTVGEGFQKESSAEDPRLVLQKHVTDTKEKHVCTLNSDGEETSKGEEDKYFISIRKRETHRTSSTSQFRRPKVRWTPEEEDMLKEGVRKFSNDQDHTIPWTTILEFGSSVFLRYRTTIDLKDKWRNICKGSSKFR